MSVTEFSISQTHPSSSSVFWQAYQDVTVAQEDSAKPMESNHQPA
jgi:hypothetical protein